MTSHIDKMSNFGINVSMSLLVFLSLAFQVNGLECEGFYQNTGTRKVSSCPDQDEFCVTYENSRFEYDESQDGNQTSDAGFNVVRVQLGCESILNEGELLGFEPDICQTDGEGCHEGVYEDDYDNVNYSDINWKVCCCKGDMCNDRNTTTTVTGTASSSTTEATTTTDGLVCEGFEQETGSRRVMACPDGDEFCVTLENKFVEFEEGPDGNATSNIAWNITQEYRGCESDLEIEFGLQTLNCKTIGEDCTEGVMGPDSDWDSDYNFKICCCKGDFCNRRPTTAASPTTTTTSSSNGRETMSFIIAFMSFVVSVSSSFCH